MISHKIPAPGDETGLSPLFGKSRAEAERKCTGRGIVGLLERVWGGVLPAPRGRGPEESSQKSCLQVPMGPSPTPKTHIPLKSPAYSPVP